MGDARTASHRRRKLELTLARGSIVSVDARAIVLGVFAGVDPSGAAAAVDRELDGAVREFTLRRMFSAQLGQVFVLPCARGRLHAEFVLFAGLGDFDAFDAGAQAFAAENVARTLARSGVDHFAMVTLGAGSGVPLTGALGQQLRGLLAGLKYSDTQGRVRRITLCELDSRKFARLARSAARILPALADDDFEVELQLGELPVGRAGAHPPPRSTRAADPAYLLVSMREDRGDAMQCRSSLLTAGAKAAVLSGTAGFRRSELRRALAPLEKGTAGLRDLPRIGQALARLLLAKTVCEGLAAMSHRPLVVVHEREASRVPWEVLHVGDSPPALAQGLSRRYESEALTVARWQDSPAGAARIRALVVSNPTGDLPGATAETDALRQMLADRAASVDLLAGGEATRARVLERLAGAQYDVLHFAGHAWFDAGDPGRSGLLCAHEEVLRGADLAGLARVPALVFCNACEAARVRRGGRLRSRPVALRTSSIAEAFLAGGVANFLGTHWPVADSAALEFSTRFYRELLGGAPLGDAVRSARNRVRDLGSVDWADYVHYGVSGFQLGRPVRDP